MIVMVKEDYELAIEHCDKAIALGHKMSPSLLEGLKPHRREESR